MKAAVPRSLSQSARFPALVCVLGLMGGIVLDVALTQTPDEQPFKQLITKTVSVWGLWSGLLLLSSLLWLLARRWAPRSTECYLAGMLLFTGAVWHQTECVLLPADHISRQITEESRPMRLVARLNSEPVLQPSTLPRFAAAWPQESRTRCTAEVLGYYESQQLRPASGQILITVQGEVSGFYVGDEVLVLGSIRNFSPPRNPAIYDFAAAMQRQSLYGSIFCDSAEALQLRRREPSWLEWLQNGLIAVRQHYRQLLETCLPPDSAAMGRALLLGERQGFEDETWQAFRQSGLMHLLSISGLHVGLMGGFFLWGAKLCGLSHHRLHASAFVGMTLCLLLAEFRPPIFRAWLIGTLLFLGLSSHRHISFLQSLSVAGCVCLLCNAAWLFDPGAQLSFLALLGILLVQQGLPGLFRSSAEWELQAGEQGQHFLKWRQELQRLAVRGCGQAFLISLVITLVTLPLLTFYFQRVTLSGIPGTMLSVPVLVAAMLGLMGLGFVGLFSQTLAEWVAIPTHFCLKTLALLAKTFQDWSLLQWPIARPSAIGILLLMTVGVLLILGRRRGWLPVRPPALLLLWTCLLIFVLELPVLGRWTGLGPTAGWECRLLSIGHGNACLLRVPNGRTILIDGGSMENGRYAAMVIQANLADMGADRLDAILISHTDTDHLNAVPFLLQQLPVRQIFLNPAGLNPRHPGMYALCEEVFPQEISLTLLQTGDKILLDPAVAVRILQVPASKQESFGDDNADSIVVEVEYQGKRILFPGDLEGAGQQNLLRLPARSYDILVAPHHGGKGENTPVFANWANPQWVLVSARYREQAEFLRGVYGAEAVLLFTSDGALRTLISDRGELLVEQWSQPKGWHPATSLDILP